MYILTSERVLHTKYDKEGSDFEWRIVKKVVLSYILSPRFSIAIILLLQYGLLEKLVTFMVLGFPGPYINRLAQKSIFLTANAMCAALVCWSKSTTVIKWRSIFWRWQKINLLGKHTAIKIEKTKKAQIILEAVYISKRERLHVRGGRILLVLNHCQSLRIQSNNTY